VVGASAVVSDVETDLPVERWQRFDAEVGDADEDAEH